MLILRRLIHAYGYALLLYILSDFWWRDFRLLLLVSFWRVLCVWFALPKVFCFSERYSCLLELFCKNYNIFGLLGLSFSLTWFFPFGMRTSFLELSVAVDFERRPRVLEQLSCSFCPPSSPLRHSRPRYFSRGLRFSFTGPRSVAFAKADLRSATFNGMRLDPSIVEHNSFACLSGRGAFG